MVKNDVIESRLTLEIITDDNIKHQIYFDEVIGWELSSFEMQNVLYDFKIYDSASLLPAIVENYEILDKYKILIYEQKYLLTTIDSSVGMGGFIVSKKVSLA